jgi:cbb3-type cytochrome oxidase maturation protein
MSALFVLIGVSLTIAVGFLLAFIWSVKQGQYDDDYTPSVRMLFENNTPQKNDKRVPSSLPKINKTKTNKFLRNKLK